MYLFNTITGDYMDKKRYKEIVDKHTPKENVDVYKRQANVIAKTNKPTLVLAHNKTLAGQLYSEFRELFPENAVCYFVSYYDRCV